MVGACIGFVGIIGVRVLVLGDSFDGLHSKFAETGMLETVGVSLLAILILLFSIFLQVLLHEGGHLVCGLATGYRFVSFRIFNLTFIRKDGKLCIKRLSLAGTGGQCLLTPPERPLEDIPTTLYNLGGVLANLLTAILAFLPLLTVDGLPYLLKFFLLMLSLIGILLAGMNGIPMKMGGIGNDADNMRLLLKDSKSKQALVTQLRINALVQEGMRPKDMPAEWFSQTEDINYKDALQVTIALMSASRLLDCEEWEAAYNAFEKIMSHRHEVIGLLIKENACELLFTALVTKRTARAEELYTDELDTYIRQYKDVTSSKQRLLCALALYRDKDTAKAKEIYEATCQRKNKYLMQGEVSSDIALMKSILPPRMPCKMERYFFYLLYLLLGCSLCGCSRKQAPKQTQDPDTETTIPYADTIAAPVPPAPVKSRTARYLDSLGYSLIVYDAARPLSVQQKMWNVVKGTSKYIYVSNPSRGGGLHNYGLAVDISILDDKGTPLPMGTPVDHLGREAHITEEAVLVAQGKLTEQERENRLLLRQVMKEAGFHPLPSEWWHFNRVSRQTAKERYRVIP